MQSVKSVVRFTGAVLGSVAILSGSALGAAAPPPLVWVAKPNALTPYRAPNKVRITLAEVQAKHRGQASWTEVVGRDNELLLQYIQMAPGAKAGPTMLADQRLSIIVWEGQIRVSIEGQAPFVASKGFMIQIPFRVPYTLETVGTTPSLRFETVSVTSLSRIYPASQTPPPPPAGYSWYKAAVPGRDTYERLNDRVYIDFFKEAAAAANATGPQRLAPNGVFIKDGRNYANIIRGPGIARQPDTMRGHFHANLGEFWFLMEGQTSFLIEGVPYFVANPGDIVYAPAGRFHRASPAGEGMATRIAILGYYNNAHFFEPGGGD